MPDRYEAAEPVRDRQYMHILENRMFSRLGVLLFLILSTKINDMLSVIVKMSVYLKNKNTPSRGECW